MQRLCPIGLPLHQGSKDFYINLRNKRPKVNQLLGTHLASVPITPSDGKLSAVRSDGHRDWHEYASTHCAADAVVVEQLAVEAQDA